MQSIADAVVIKDAGYELRVPRRFERADGAADVDVVRVQGDLDVQVERAEPNEG